MSLLLLSPTLNIHKSDIETLRVPNVRLSAFPRVFHQCNFPNISSLLPHSTPTPPTPLHQTTLQPQVVLASVTIVPIRAFFMFFFLLLAWPVAYFATYGIENDLGKEPLTGWRRSVHRIHLLFQIIYTICDLISFTKNVLAS